MATLPSIPSPTPCGMQRMKAPSGPKVPKLRDSCHPCASSKVKCHKEKPTCSRCAKRGFRCEYFATRRSGRKHDKNKSEGSSSIVDNGSRNRNSSDVTVANALPPQRSLVTAPSATFAGLLSPTSLSSDFDVFLTSPASFNALDEPDYVPPSQLHLSSSGIDYTADDTVFGTFPDAFTAFEDAVSEFPSLPDSRLCSQSLVSLMGEPQIFCASDSPFCCIVRALGLMRQLCTRTPIACKISDGQGPGNHDPPTVRSVIASNEETIEATRSMLQCPCSEDCYLLTIMSLIVFKMIGWYDAVARGTALVINDEHDMSNNNSGAQSPGTSCSAQSWYSGRVVMDSSVGGNYCVNENPTDMMRELVLGGLHHVQRLANQLSTKLKLQIAKHNRAGAEMSGNMRRGSVGIEVPLPFSLVMLEQLADELPKRLKALSQDIADGLRRE